MAQPRVRNGQQWPSGDTVATDEDKVTVLRFEDSNGFGCYQNCHVKAIPYYYAESDRLNYNKPMPHEDIPNFTWKDNHVCGFADESQMKAWFEELDRIELEKLGSKLVRYEVPDEHVLVGASQVVFDRSKAKKLETSGQHCESDLV